jgi:hypothetical protein
MFFILDNRTDQVRPAREVSEYTPIVSYSGDFEWVYSSKSKGLKSLGGRNPAKAGALVTTEAGFARLAATTSPHP